MPLALAVELAATLLVLAVELADVPLGLAVEFATMLSDSAPAAPTGESFEGVQTPGQLRPLSSAVFGMTS